MKVTRSGIKLSNRQYGSLFEGVEGLNKFNMKEGIHIISFYPINERQTPKLFHEIIEGRRDWSILKGK